MNAIGLIEVIGYVAAVEASDTCLKSANVDLVSIDKVGSGIVTLTISGDVGAVKSAVEAAEISVSRVGTLRFTHVIPKIDNEVANILFKKEEILEKNDSKEVVIEEKSSEDPEIEIQKSKEETLIDIKVEEHENIKEEVLEDIDIHTDKDKEILYKMSVKELKALAKTLDSSLTNKELNSFKKEELIEIVIKLNREDR